MKKLLLIAITFISIQAGTLNIKNKSNNWIKVYTSGKRGDFTTPLGSIWIPNKSIKQMDTYKYIPYELDIYTYSDESSKALEDKYGNSNLHHFSVDDPQPENTLHINKNQLNQIRKSTSNLSITFDGNTVKIKGDKGTKEFEI